MTSELRLFDDVSRSDPRPARYAEGSFAFLNRVDDPYFAAARRLMEAWFARYPKEHRHGLRAMFRGDDQRETVSAFWELYLHELHRRLGFQITIHPAVPGTAKRPDFRVDDGEHAFYIEAVVAAHSDEEVAQRMREAIVLDTINECKNPNFSLTADWECIGRTTPRREEVLGKVEGWLASLDSQAVRESLAPYGWDDPRPSPAPNAVIKFGDWAIRLTAYPRTVRDDDLDHRIIGSPPMTEASGDDIKRVLETLKGKASRYGKPDLPYVIAVGLMLDFAEFDDLEQALYGPEGFTIVRRSADGQPEMVRSRLPDGLWQRGPAHRGTRVSAVLSLRSPYMYSLTSSEPSIWINPWASKPLDYEYPFSTVVADCNGNRLRRSPGALAAHEAFGLAQDWPGVQAFARRHARLFTRAKARLGAPEV
jgi:hypothetical protein